MRRLASNRGAVAAVETGLPDGAGDKITLTVNVKPGEDDGTSSLPAPTPRTTAAFPAGEGGGLRPQCRPQSCRSCARLFRRRSYRQGAQLTLSGSVPESYGSSFDIGRDDPRQRVRRAVHCDRASAAWSSTSSLRSPTPRRSPSSATRPQQSSVVFILDCSASMATDIPVELIDAQKLPRLEIAKSVLESLLEQLAIRGDTRRRRSLLRPSGRLGERATLEDAHAKTITQDRSSRRCEPELRCGAGVAARSVLVGRVRLGDVALEERDSRGVSRRCSFRCKTRMRDFDADKETPTKASS